MLLQASSNPFESMNREGWRSQSQDRGNSFPSSSHSFHIKNMHSSPYKEDFLSTSTSFGFHSSHYREQRKRGLSNPVPIPPTNHTPPTATSTTVTKLLSKEEEEGLNRFEMEMFLEQKNIEMLALIRGVTPQQAYVMSLSDDLQESPYKHMYTNDDDNEEEWEKDGFTSKESSMKDATYSREDDSYNDVDKDDDGEEMFQLEL